MFVTGVSQTSGMVVSSYRNRVVTQFRFPPVQQFYCLFTTCELSSLIFSLVAFTA